MGFLYKVFRHQRKFSDGQSREFTSELLADDFRNEQSQEYN